MRGRVRMELRSQQGETLELREASNAVMQAGAQLIARLFTGQGKFITHMGVGTSDAPETQDFNTAGLANDQTAPLAGGTEAAVAQQDFVIDLDKSRRIVRVKLRATLPAAAAVGTVREAGLVSRDGNTTVLYNRVTFAPIHKGNDHELTMFWEVTFPYGDLQGF